MPRRNTSTNVRVRSHTIDHARKVYAQSRRDRTAWVEFLSDVERVRSTQD